MTIVNVGQKPGGDEAEAVRRLGLASGEKVLDEDAIQVDFRAKQPLLKEAAKESAKEDIR